MSFQDDIEDRSEPIPPRPDRIVVRGPNGERRVLELPPLEELDLTPDPEWVAFPFCPEPRNADG